MPRENLWARAYRRCTRIYPLASCGSASARTLRRRCCLPSHFLTHSLYTFLVVFAITTSPPPHSVGTHLFLRTPHTRLPGGSTRASACGLPRHPPELTPMLRPTAVDGSRRRCAHEVHSCSIWIWCLSLVRLEAVAFRRVAITRIVPQGGVYATHGGPGRPSARRYAASVIFAPSHHPARSATYAVGRLAFSRILRIIRSEYRVKW